MDRNTAERLYQAGMEPTVTKLLELDAHISEQDALINTLNDRIDKLSKNSSNSSKPPSSDIVKKKKQTRASRRREKKRRAKGGQPGHTRHERKLFLPDEVNEWRHYELSSCPDCGGILEKCDDSETQVLQQVEFPTKPVTITQHQGLAYWCEHCKKYHYAPIPEAVQRAGLFDADVSAMVCWLKYAGSVSLSKIQRLFRDVYGIKVSQGYLCKVINKGAQALEQTYNEILKALQKERVVNADETGHKNNGKRHWTWVFRTSLYALFKISPSRASGVIIDVLGKEFNGVLGCDCYSSYIKYMKDFDVVLQLCLAHLIRDVKALVDCHDTEVRKYGTRILDELKNLFHVIHSKEEMSSDMFVSVLQRCKESVIRAATKHVPAHRLARNMAKRFRKYGEAYFTFITTPGMDPTNNCAEQAIRFVVMYRHSSQGTRSAQGMIACERFFTVVASCFIQGRSVYDFIKEAFRCYFEGLPAPSLLPAPAAPP